MPSKIERVRVSRVKFFNLRGCIIFQSLCYIAFGDCGKKFSLCHKKFLSAVIVAHTFKLSGFYSLLYLTHRLYHICAKKSIGKLIVYKKFTFDAPGRESSEKLHKKFTIADFLDDVPSNLRGRIIFLPLKILLL